MLPGDASQFGHERATDQAFDVATLDPGRADVARLATIRHPALAEELLRAVDTLAAKWNLAGQVFRVVRE